MKPFRFSIVVSAMVLGLSAEVWGINGTPSWFESDVGTPLANSYASTPVLAFDHYGTPSVAWSSVSTAGGTNSVRYSQLLGLGLWNTRELANGSSLGLRTSLAFDRSERPSVAWINFNGSVNGSFNLGTSQELASAGANSSFPIISLSYDLAGSLRGMYGRLTTGNFFDIGYSGGSFNQASMTTLPGVTTVFDAAMTTDSRGLRQLAARANLTGGSQGLVISSEPPGGGAWPSVNFVTADNVTGVDIAMDPTDGRVALAYTTRDNAGLSKLFYSKHNGFVMQTSELASSTLERFEDVSLAFDFSDGHPAIAYERRIVAGGAEQLMFAYRDNSAVWQLPPTPVDATISLDGFGGKPRRPSLAFDDYGTSWPAIAYIDSDGSLNVAFDPPVPEPGTLSLLLISIVIARRRENRPLRRAAVFPCG